MIYLNDQENKIHKKKKKSGLSEGIILDCVVADDARWHNGRQGAFGSRDLSIISKQNV